MIGCDIPESRNDEGLIMPVFAWIGVACPIGLIGRKTLFGFWGTFVLPMLFSPLTPPNSHEMKRYSPNCALNLLISVYRPISTSLGYSYNLSMEAGLRARVKLTPASVWESTLPSKRSPSLVYPPQPASS
jgi:hypothetical protein